MSPALITKPATFLHSEKIFVALIRWHCVFLASAAVLLCGCERKSGSVRSNATSTETQQAAVSQGRYDSEKLFTEITSEFGLPEQVPTYPDGTFMTPEITPSGVAVFDFDNDGLLGVLHVRHPAPIADSGSAAYNLSGGLLRTVSGGNIVLGLGLNGDGQVNVSATEILNSSGDLIVGGGDDLGGVPIANSKSRR
jgi:hypothetical protein